MRQGPPARRIVAAVLIHCAVLVIPLAGCGQPAAPAGPTAETWARSICSALAPWRTTIAGLNTQAQQQLATATTPEQTRDKLLTLLSGARAATDETRATVAAAGVPPVEHGPEIAAEFGASLAGARDAYDRAWASVKALSIKDAKIFYDGLVKIFNTLTADYAKTGVDTSGLDSPELRQAFGQVTECR